MARRRKFALSDRVVLKSDPTKRGEIMSVCQSPNRKGQYIVSWAPALHREPTFVHGRFLQHESLLEEIAWASR